MTQPQSISKREQAIKLLEAGISVAKIAENLQIPVATIYNWRSHSPIAHGVGAMVEECNSKLIKIFGGSESELTKMLMNTTSTLIEALKEAESSSNPSSKTYGLINKASGMLQMILEHHKPNEEHVKAQKKKRDAYLNIARAFIGSEQISEAEKWIEKAGTEWPLSSDQERTLNRAIKAAVLTIPE